jgi:hypothetical protein
MELYVDLTIQFFEGGDAFRNTHTLKRPRVTVKKEDLACDEILADILATHFSKEIDAIIEREYGGAGYEVMGVDYDEGYASLRIDIEE